MYRYTEACIRRRLAENGVRARSPEGNAERRAARQCSWRRKGLCRVRDGLLCLLADNKENSWNHLAVDKARRNEAIVLKAPKNIFGAC